MEIQIKNLQKKILLNLPHIKRLMRGILKYQKVKEYQLSLVFVTGQRIRALNKKYLNRQETTDVLAFDFTNQSDLPKPSSRLRKTTVIGDIVISTDAVIKNSKIYQTTFAQELILYVIHGILHLTGYDDHEEKDILKMRKKEKELMSFLSHKVNPSILEKS